MKKLQSLTILVGRVFLSLFFILSAINKILDWQEVERGLIAVLCDWNVYLSSSGAIQKIFANFLDWVPVLLLVLTLLELIGGLLLLLGIKVRLAAVLLILFFVPTTVLFHHFWFIEESRQELEFAFFLKNIAILGGLLYALAHGGKVREKKNKIEETIEFKEM